MVSLYREKLWPQPEHVDLSPEALGSMFRPRSQFFPIRTSQPVNNIYILQLSRTCLFLVKNREFMDHRFKPLESKKKTFWFTGQPGTPGTQAIIVFKRSSANFQNIQKRRFWLKKNNRRLHPREAGKGAPPRVGLGTRTIILWWGWGWGGSLKVELNPKPKNVQILGQFGTLIG